MESLRAGILALVLLLTAITPTFASAQTILRVDLDAAPGGDGTSWSSAYQELGTALAAAAPISGHVEIWVAEGVYLPSYANDPTASFLLPGDVSLLGGFAGGETSSNQRDPINNKTRLSGDLGFYDQQFFQTTQQLMRAVDLSAPSLVDGVTFKDALATEGGAGIWIERSDLTLRDCIFTDHTSAPFDPSPSAYPGVLAPVTIQESGTLLVEDCKFTDNQAHSGGGISVNATNGGIIDLTVRNSIFKRNTTDLDGAGIWFEGNRLVIEDSRFTDGQARDGGAVSTRTGVDIEIRDSTFLRNTAGHGGAVLANRYFGATMDLAMTGCVFGDNIGGNSGGGLTFYGTDLLLEDTEFRDNSAGDGGAAKLTIDTGAIRDCQFNRNSASWRAGALRILTPVLVPTPIPLERCTFDDNSMSGGVGGAVQIEAQVYMTDCQVRGTNGSIYSSVEISGRDGNRMTNCLVVDNSAQFFGGVRVLVDTEFRNCTIANNRSTDFAESAAGIEGDQASITLTNVILWGNRYGTGPDDNLPGVGGDRAQLRLVNNSTLNWDYSLVEGVGAIGNILNTDPEFLDPAGLDFRLAETSPAIDAGDNTVVAELNDLDGEPRITDGDGDTQSVVDLGAYESPEMAPTPVPLTLAAKLHLMARLQGSRVQIDYQVPRSSPLKLQVFDVRGRLVKTVASTFEQGGQYDATWPLTDRSGRSVASGVYFIRLSTQLGNLTERVVVLR